MAKLPAQLMVELTRLHTLYMKVPSQFSWRNTETSLSWMNAMRARLNEGKAVVPVSLAGQESRCWETASQREFESQADDHSLTHVAPAMFGSLAHQPGLEFLAVAPELPQMPTRADADPMGVSDQYTGIFGEAVAFDGGCRG